MLFFLLALGIASEEAQGLPYEKMADRIATSLKVTTGERVLLRVHAETMSDLAPVVQKRLERDGASVRVLAYGPAPDFEQQLEKTDVYVWLPAPSTATPPDQSAVLWRWVDRGGGRELHFHWTDGTRRTDGTPAPHTAAYDKMYLDALDIDYVALGAEMDRAIQRLRAGEVRVTSPAGTNVTFRVGDRPFNKQDGDGSKARAARGQMRIDRHIELPAGVLRVAPIEESVNGVIVVPSMHLPGGDASGVRLEIERGKVVRATARTNQDKVAALIQNVPAAASFREFGLGFNPRLKVAPNDIVMPYYGYGAGVVRLSLGDNTELAGSVRGGFVMWMFFPDTTVTAGGETLVSHGRLAAAR
jgi:aminopeptidase